MKTTQDRQDAGSSSQLQLQLTSRTPCTVLKKSDQDIQRTMLKDFQLSFPGSASDSSSDEEDREGLDEKSNPGDKVISDRYFLPIMNPTKDRPDADSNSQLQLQLTPHTPCTVIKQSDQDIQQAMLKDFQLSFPDESASDSSSDEEDREWLDVKSNHSQIGPDHNKNSASKYSNGKLAVFSIKSDECSGLKKDKLKLSMKPKAMFRKAIAAYCVKLKLSERELKFTMGGRIVPVDQMASGLAGKTVLASYKNGGVDREGFDGCDYVTEKETEAVK